jgi:hypothetical protein
MIDKSLIFHSIMLAYVLFLCYESLMKMWITL